MSIAFGVGVECLSAEVADDKTLLQESSEITFSNEDIKVGYPDHKRSLYLAASMNQIPIKRALSPGISVGKHSTPALEVMLTNASVAILISFVVSPS